AYTAEVDGVNHLDASEIRLEPARLFLRALCRGDRLDRRAPPLRIANWSIDEQIRPFAAVRGDETQIPYPAFRDETAQVCAGPHDGEGCAAGGERRVNREPLWSGRGDGDRPFVARRRRRGRLREQGHQNRERQRRHAVLSGRASTNFCSASDTSA